MGKRHSRSERRRFATQTRKSGIETVAARAGVKPETVVKWRNEFGITGGPTDGRALSPTEAAGLSLDVDPLGHGNRPELSESAREDLVDEFASAMQEARESYVMEWRDWFEDKDQQREDAKALRQLVDDWESEHGALTASEKIEAQARLRQ